MGSVYDVRREMYLGNGSFVEQRHFECSFDFGVRPDAAPAYLQNSADNGEVILCETFEYGKEDNAVLFEESGFKLGGGGYIKEG